MSTLYTYDPKHLTVKVNGTAYIKGFAETQVTISRSDAMFNTQVGATGHTMRVKTNNRTTDVTLTLQQGSPSLSTLDFLAEADEGDETKGVFEIQIDYNPQGVDSEGSALTVSLLSSSCAYIEKKPDGTWSNSPNDREWLIKCADATFKPSNTAFNDHFFAANREYATSDGTPGTSTGYSDAAGLPNPYAAS